MTSLVQLLLLTALSLASFAPEARANSVPSRPHVDLAPITLQRLRTRTDRNSTSIDGPSTFAKIPRQHRSLEERATGNPKGASFYSAVVAVGAS